MQGILIREWWEKDQPIVGHTIPGMVVLGSIRKANWTRHEEKTSKQHPFMTSVSVPASRCLVPVLTSFSDEHWYGVSAVPSREWSRLVTCLINALILINSPNMWTFPIYSLRSHENRPSPTEDGEVAGSTISAHTLFCPTPLMHSCYLYIEKRFPQRLQKPKTLMFCLLILF